jgi:SAM-dependent methyltransferase
MDEYETIAPFYDCEHDGFRDDIEFYINMLPPGSVLEVGSGTGRIAEALGDAGFQVVGVESSRAMLDRARARLEGRSGIQLIQGRMEDVALPHSVASAILPLNALWHAPDPEGQIRLLSAVRRALVPAGLLVIDLSNPFTMADGGCQGEVRVRFRGTCEGHEVIGWSVAWDDRASQRLDLDLTYDVTTLGGSIRRTSTRLALRYVYEPELTLMLRMAGFSVRGTYGSYDLEPYDAASPSLIVVSEAV